MTEDSKRSIFDHPAANVHVADEHLAQQPPVLDESWGELKKRHRDPEPEGGK